MQHLTVNEILYMYAKMGGKVPRGGILYIDVYDDTYHNT